MLDIMFELPDRPAKDKGKYMVTGEIVRKEKNLFDAPAVPIPRPESRAEEGKRLSAAGAPSPSVGRPL